MSSSKEDREKLLEKIRADMAASRARIDARKNSTETILSSNPPAVEVPITSDSKVNSDSQTTSDAKTTPDTSGKRVVLVRKKADGTEERIVKEVGVGSDGNLIGPDGKVLRVRKVSVAEDRPDVSSLVNRPMDHGSRRISENNRQKVLTKETSTPPTGLGKTKNIRSLEDMQNAIRKADQIKQQVKEQGKIEEIERQQREEKRTQMSREERRAYRQSKRMTVELQQNETRVKVDQQIGRFMQMMQQLEADWQKGEEERIKREQELFEQRQLIEKAAEDMQFLTQSLNDLTARMDHLKLLLDRMLDSVPKSVMKKDEKWFNDLKTFQEKFWEMRHQAYISTAKYKKELEQSNAQQTKSEIPGAPKPPPSSTPSVNPISNLLSQIRQGTSLRKLDAETIQKERNERKGNWRQSVQLLQGLQDTLRDALSERQLALLDSDSDDDDDDDEWDE